MTDRIYRQKCSGDGHGLRCIFVRGLDRETNIQKMKIPCSFAGQADSGEEAAKSLSHFRQLGAAERWKMDR